MNNIGICQEISGEYIYYLLQIGINATNCSALSRDKSCSHEWTVVELDNHHYHIDPTFSIGVIWNPMTFARKKARNREEVNLEAFHGMEISGKCLLW